MGGPFHVRRADCKGKAGSRFKEPDLSIKRTKVALPARRRGGRAGGIGRDLGLAAHRRALPRSSFRRTGTCRVRKRTTKGGRLFGLLVVYSGPNRAESVASSPATLFSGSRPRLDLLDPGCDLRRPVPG